MHRSAQWCEHLKSYLAGLNPMGFGSFFASWLNESVLQLRTWTWRQCKKTQEQIVHSSWQHNNNNNNFSSLAFSGSSGLYLWPPHLQRHHMAQVLDLHSTYSAWPSSSLSAHAGDTNCAVCADNLIWAMISGYKLHRSKLTRRIKEANKHQGLQGQDNNNHHSY